MDDGLLKVAEAIEYWEATRLRVRTHCETKAMALIEEIGGGIGRLATQDLLLPDSKPLSALGDQLRQGIIRLERELAKKITEGEPVEERLRFHRGVIRIRIPSVAKDILSGQSGFGLSDIISLVAGGGAAAGAIQLGGRAAPAALAAVGLGGVVTVPITMPIVAAGTLVTLGLNAYRLPHGKRQKLRQWAKSEILRLVLEENGKQPSVLMNHLAYVDKLYAPLMEI